MRCSRSPLSATRTAIPRPGAPTTFTSKIQILHYPFPLGQVQPVGSFHFEMMKGDAPPLTPGFVLEAMKHHAVPWWLTTEDLPDPGNRVTLHNTTPLSVESSQPGVVGAHPAGDTGHTNESETVTDSAPMRIQLSYTPNNVESFKRLKDRWVDVLKQAGHATTSVPLHAYFKKRIPLEGVGHQNGTCRMGSRSSDQCARPALQGSRSRQPLCGRCFLLRLRECRQSIADNHRQCHSHRGSFVSGRLQ